jgi:hypothetical protein
MVLKTIRPGRLVLVIGDQEPPNYSKGPPGLSPLRSDGSRDGHVWGWTSFPIGHSRAVFSQANAKGSSSLRSDGSCDSKMRGWTSCLVAKMLKWELENNSRQPGDLTETGRVTDENSFSWEDEEGRCWSWWCWWVRTNQTATGLCESDSGYWGIIATDQFK